MTAYETDSWKFVPARWFQKTPTGTRRGVRVIVIHDMEAPENALTAENVANYFATTETQASSHICVDNNSIIQCVKDNDVAYAAPGANHDGIQIELAGYAKQTLKEWLDDYGVQMLNRAADATAQYCLKYGIPARWLSNGDLHAGMKGVVGHNQVSEVYRKSTHRDPGPGFPWEYFMCAVRQFVELRS